MSEKLGNLTVSDEQLITDGDGGGSDGGSGVGDVINPTDIEPPKRGRGRPRKSDAGDTDNRPGKSARAGSAASAKPSKKATHTVVNTDGLAFVIGVIGNFVAARAKMEALALDSDEQKQIAEAAGNVLKLYEIPVNEKTAAWGGLAMTLGTIYGGKIAAIKLSRSLQKG